MHPTDALGVPRLVLGQGAEEHFVTAEGVCAVALDELIGGLHVVLRLGHFLHLVTAGVGAVVVQDEFRVGEFSAPRPEAVEVELVVVHEVDVDVQALGAMGFALVARHKGVGPLDAVHKAGPAQNHPLVDHGLERLVKSDVAEVVQELGPKARVKQVPCRVFRAADVQVDLPPIVALAAVTERVFVVGVHVAQEVPAAAGPSGHGVGLHGVATEHGPIFTGRTGQRRLAVLGGEVGIHLGQGHRGVCDARGDPVFVSDGEGLAPVPLTAEDSVADAVVHLAGAAALGFHPIEGEGDGVTGAHAVPFARVAEDGALVRAHGFLGVHILEDGRNGEVKVFGEAPIALVAGGNRHDGTGSVPRENVIGNPHGDKGSGDGVHDVSAGEHP